MSDAIVLVGLSASGKSSVGRLVAEVLGRPFVDVDAQIAARAGCSPARIIERDGEARFREIEAAEVTRAVAVAGAVIATGGGAVIDPLSRWALWDAGTVVWLDASDDRLASRLRHSDVRRPMVAGDPLAALGRLRAAREPFYAAADIRVESAGTARTMAATIADALGHRRPGARRLFDARTRRDHPMGPREARIVYGRDLDAATLEPLVASLSTGAPVVVADERAAEALPDLMAAFPGERPLRITAGERGKRLSSVERLLEAAAGLRAERGDAWIAIGGGTTGDLVGTAAALYHRGAPLIQVPTTWLAQADSAIGGKVAVDLARGQERGRGLLAARGGRRGRGRAPDAAPRPAARRTGRGAQVGHHRRSLALDAARDAWRGSPRVGRRQPGRRGRPVRDGGTLHASQAGRGRPRPIRVAASGGRSTWATPSATPWRSRAATGCRTARRSCWACGPWRPSPKAVAPSRASANVSMTCSIGWAIG